MIGAAADFRAVAGDAEGERRACCRYFNRGYEADIFSTGELVDFLGASTPSVLDMAGYSDEDAQRVMEVVGDLSGDEIRAATEWKT